MTDDGYLLTPVVSSMLSAIKKNLTITTRSLTRRGHEMTSNSSFLRVGVLLAGIAILSVTASGPAEAQKTTADLSGIVAKADGTGIGGGGCRNRTR